MTDPNFAQAERAYEQQLPDDDCDTDWGESHEDYDDHWNDKE